MLTGFCGFFLLSCMSDFPFGIISLWPENTVQSCLGVGLLVLNSVSVRLTIS